MQFGSVTIPKEHVVYESEFSYAFVSLRPFLPHHMLVSPKRRSTVLLEMSEEESLDLFKTIRLLTKALSSLADAWTITLQDGEAAGQTIKHVHFHLIPRIKNDLKCNNDVYKGIETDVDRPDSSSEEMASEALFLRKILRDNGVNE